MCLKFVNAFKPHHVFFLFFFSSECDLKLRVRARTRSAELVRTSSDRKHSGCCAHRCAADRSLSVGSDAGFDMFELRG